MDLHAFYDSAWQQPGLLAALGVPAGAHAAWQATRGLRSERAGAGFLARWTVLFAAVAVIDCVLTGATAPLGAGSDASVAASVAFVYLGDLRLFLLGARFTRARWTSGGVAEAIGWAAIPSLLIALLKRVAPWTVADARHLFLIYELCALALMLSWWALLIPRRAAADGVGARWVRLLFAFGVAQYALWAGADLAILAGAGWGWGLRVIPNLLYYSAFVAFAWRAAPKDLRP